MSPAHLHEPRGLTLSLHLSPLVQQANLIPGAVPPDWDQLADNLSAFPSH